MGSRCRIPIWSYDSWGRPMCERVTMPQHSMRASVTTFQVPLHHVESCSWINTTRSTITFSILHHVECLPSYTMWSAPITYITMWNVITITNTITSTPRGVQLGSGDLELHGMHMLIIAHYHKELWPIKIMLCTKAVQICLTDFSALSFWDLERKKFFWCCLLALSRHGSL